MDLKTIKVLVVDDSVSTRFHLSSLLSTMGISSIEASNGKEALSVLMANPDCRLVVCDLNMPEVNGFEFIEEVRKQPSIEAIPVIMLTTEVAKDLVQRGKALGVTAWMIKPFQRDQFSRAIEAILASTGSRRQT